jgi:hypothetical protein
MGGGAGYISGGEMGRENGSLIRLLSLCLAGMSEMLHFFVTIDMW